MMKVAFRCNLDPRCLLCINEFGIRAVAQSDFAGCTRGRPFESCRVASDCGVIVVLNAAVEYWTVRIRLSIFGATYPGNCRRVGHLSDFHAAGLMRLGAERKTALCDTTRQNAEEAANVG
jgi:hypothetical protein